MTKIGTAHLEIKPVVNEEALAAITQRIQEAVEAGVKAAFASRERDLTYQFYFENGTEGNPTDVTFPLSADNPLA